MIDKDSENNDTYLCFLNATNRKAAAGVIDRRKNKDKKLRFLLDIC